jgi:hypothetical protein
VLTRRDSTRQAIAIDLRPGLRVLHIAAAVHA